MVLITNTVFISGDRIMYLFLKVTDFIGQTGTYFKQRELHVSSDIHTVGQIVYASDNILLKSLSGNKEVVVNFLNDLIPEDGTYVHLYGHMIFFKDLRNNSWFNFEEDNLTGNLNIIVNCVCWANLQHVTHAKRLEQLLYTSNYEIC